MADNQLDNLGKPAAKWKTLLTKADAVTKIVFSVSSIAIGAVAMANARGIANAVGHAGVVWGANESVVKATTDLVAKMMRYTGIGTMAGGAIMGVFGKAEFDSANSASRARNHIRLCEQLNAMQPAGRS